MIHIDSIHVGQPMTVADEQGEWQSSIFRTTVSGPVELTVAGLAGDQVADTRYHGSPDQAVCCHSIDHYEHWRSVYPDHAFPAGAVGENWTLLNADEGEICIGDVYAVGSAQVQVTSPRMPCWKQARKLAIADFHKRTIEALRTGFYLRVLAPGTVQAGDRWDLVTRLDAPVSLLAANRCRYAAFDRATAEQLAATPELMTAWRAWFEKRLS